MAERALAGKLQEARKVSMGRTWEAASSTAWQKWQVGRWWQAVGQAGKREKEEGR